MPTRPTGVTDNANAAGIVDVDVIERPSYDITTTTTADPGAAGTSLAVTLRDKFPQSGQFKIRVEAEVMLVTAGQGTGAGSFTVTRAQDGTTGVAHASGVTVAQVVGVQRVEPVDGSRIVTYKGRINSFRTPGRASTSQNILSLHNATGSLIKVRVSKIWFDVIHAAAAGIAPTIIAPIIRVWKVTVLPTNGTALTKVPLDSTLASSASVTVLGDASADGTGSGTTLTATLPAGTFAAQEAIPRMLVVGTSASTFEETLDRAVFFQEDGSFITLNALEGIVLNVSAATTTGNPTTDHYVAGLEWEEYTVA